jgi:hypothetical protein
MPSVSRRNDGTTKLASVQDTKDAVRAFTGSGPMQLAIKESGERTVSEAVRQALRPYTRPDGRVTLPAWYRAVITKVIIL